MVLKEFITESTSRYFIGDEESRARGKVFRMTLSSPPSPLFFFFFNEKMGGPYQVACTVRHVGHVGVFPNQSCGS